MGSIGEVEKDRKVWLLLGCAMMVLRRGKKTLSKLIAKATEKGGRELTNAQF